MKLESREGGRKEGNGKKILPLNDKHCDPLNDVRAFDGVVQLKICKSGPD